MDALKLLKQQHDGLQQLFAQFEQADSARKRQLFLQIADTLAAHTSIEEQRFYPAVYLGPLEPQLQEAVEEHLAAKRVLADLLELEVGEGNFDAKMKVLQELVEHHVKEEEQELFQAVRANFAPHELEAIGEEMRALYTQLMQEEPRRNIPRETGEAAPLS